MFFGNHEPKKAMIVKYDKDGKRPFVMWQFKDYIKFVFNPEAVTYHAGTNFAIQKLAGAANNPIIYGGHEPTSLTMNVIFDVTEEDGLIFPANNKNVRKYTDFLGSLLYAEKKRRDFKHVPILCSFEWGNFSTDPSKSSGGSPLSFLATMTQLTVNFTLFRHDGTPVRADTTIQFSEYRAPKNPGGQNPTSRSDPRRTIRVLPGQTLDYIANVELGSSARWRDIAKENDLANPRDLTPGMLLRMPLD